LKSNSEKIYRLIFWFGYAMMIIESGIPLKFDLHKITINVITFRFHFDQVLHAIVYFLITLYFFAGRFFSISLFRDNQLRNFLIAVLFLATFTESVQMIVPTRSFNLFDWLANLIGLSFGLLTGKLIASFRHRIKTRK
jgi:VanZ family protein